MFRSQVLLWLFGGVVAVVAALGAYWRVSNWDRPAEDADPVCPGEGDDSDATLTLSESQRTYLWDIEHGGNLLVKYGFGPLTAALRKADASALLSALGEDFQGRAPQEVKETAWKSDHLTVVRRKDSGPSQVPLSRTEFVERLLDYRRQFHQEPRVKLALMKLSPLGSDDQAETWQGTGQLRMWGEKAPGEPAEVVVYLSYTVRRPTEATLKNGGWMTSCAITQGQEGHARHFLMREVAAARGLDVASLHDNRTTKPELTNTGGVFLCDFDRDGILDMLVTDPNGYWLYKGMPDGTFRDVTLKVGLPRKPLVPGYHGPAAFIDIDGDGWDDLILGQSIFKNVDGKFINKNKECNLNLPDDAVGYIVADYDRDGRLDLYVPRAGIGKKDSWLGGKSGNPQANQLWHNKGNWQFEEVSARSGAGGGNRSSFSAAWLDANNDGWPDLYVPNEFGNGVLLINQGNGTFKEHALTKGPCDFGTMGLVAGDINNDGNTDLYLSNMYSKAGMRVIGNVKPGSYPDDVMAHIRTFVTGSQLHLNRGNLQFEQKGQEWQVNDCGWAYGAALIDLDNDGWLDLYATCGYISRDRHKPDG
jgi:hypothetical protein